MKIHVLKVNINFERKNNLKIFNLNDVIHCTFKEQIFYTIYFVRNEYYSIFSRGKLHILVNKRNDTKIFFRIYFYVKTKTIVYYHLCQCLRETRLIYPYKTNNNILLRYGKIPECQFFLP